MTPATRQHMPWPYRVPFAPARTRIGLFGGSFNPPHGGHRLVADRLRIQLGLSQVWWLVTPGNPLKPNAELAPLRQRVAAVEALIDSPAMRACGFEKTLRFSYSYQTIDFLRHCYDAVQFVWLVGADSFADLHRWRRWHHLCHTIPIAVYDRPGFSTRALTGIAAQVFRRYRRDLGDAHAFAFQPAPAWMFLSGPLSTLSSTQLRASLSL